MIRADLETVDCNLCGSDKYRPVYRMPDTFYHRDEWFQVVACEVCGLGFVNPRPTAAAMDHYYPKDFFEYFHRDAGFHARRYRREAQFLAGVRPKSGEAPRLLDVGCANGDFPRHMRAQGWDVTGVEIASSADEIRDFPVFRTLFPAIPVAEPHYDAVTAWAVLEHVHDPMAYFRKAAQVLKSGGLFVFLVTNFDSVSSRCLFREDLPRHLYFFSRRTVAAYLEKSGLVLEHSRFDGSIYEMAPLHWLRFYLRRLVGQPALQWDELPESRVDYCRRRGLTDGAAGQLAYAITHPFTTADRILMPAFAKWQELTGSYGIGSFVARKP